MKRYTEYMDNIEVSDTLHQRLAETETPQKRPVAWKKYGAAAAALALIAGMGAWGLSQGGWNALMENFRPNAAAMTPEIADGPVPDIAIDPDGIPGQETHTGGGYEVVNGEMVSYYLLPWLNWADASQGTAMDYALAPPSAIQRDASLDDVLAFTGGEKAMADHLLWDGLDWGGTVWFLEDGTPCAAFLYADENGLHLSLEVMKGGKVPSCIALPEDSYERSTWGGVEITALKNGGYMVTDDGAELREKREVSFFFDGVGYKLTLYADDAPRADEMCARFVRYAIDNGFHLDALTFDGTVPARSYYSVGEPVWEGGVPEEDSGDAEFYCDCPDCINGTVHTHPYDPSAPN